MVQFTLPKNSKVKQGKAWNPPPEGAEMAVSANTASTASIPTLATTRGSTPIGWTWTIAGRWCSTR